MSTDPLPVAATWGRLQTFLAVYESGSVRAAAETLHVTPPAVSAALTALYPFRANVSSMYPVKLYTVCK